MEVSEIKDRDSLRAWLEALPQETEAEKEEARRWAVMIAHRAAMRVLPVYWRRGHDVPAPNPIAITHTLHLFIVQELSAFAPSRELARVAKAFSERYKTSSRRIFDDDDDFYDGAALAQFANGYAICGSAAISIGNTRTSLADLAQLVSGAVGFSYGFGRSVYPVLYEDTLWREIGFDCIALNSRQSLQVSRLWQQESPITPLWGENRPKILAQGDGWGFWVDWYENALHGRPQDYALLTKIALIDPEDWDKGADHVNALIADIRLKHIAETRPLGEDAIEQGPDGLWHRVGRSDIDRDILQDAIDSVSDEIRRLRGKLHGPQGNMFTALIADLDLLDERLARYPDRPLRLHDTFLRVQAHVAHNLDCGELPDDAMVRDLNSVLGTAAMDMRNACPKTKSVVAARIAAQFSEADEDARADLAQIAEAAASLSDAELAGEFREDAQVVIDPNASEPERKPVLYRLVVRLAKIVVVAGAGICAALMGLGALSQGAATYTQILYAILRFVFSI